MTDLPLDPSEWPGTPEHTEFYEDRKRRALQRRLNTLDDDYERNHLRHA